MENNADIIVNDLPKVLGNKELLESLFQNLISNALKFKKDDVPSIIYINAERENSTKCKITIEDNRIGFDMIYIKTILRPFGRIHPSTKKYSGLGIGLPLCKKIVESHGGKLVIESVVGKGSKFSFTLRECH